MLSMSPCLPEVSKKQCSVIPALPKFFDAPIVTVTQN
ncbi:hypothetical protein ACOMICROBIO_LMKGKHOH_03950 [Vibrio sp. B1FIG11]|nr:hypothetical protein ACOMICROBIO_LMKGKHOH_03950 [Vibrio sp. B1FIG11]CAE6962220.1 hypothetical protein ACOMICROBIO_LMKGKHOH_03950 [Vibrio sp. B1FIG11]